MSIISPDDCSLALRGNYMENRSVPAQWNEMKKAALALGIQPQLCDVHKPKNVEAAFHTAMAERTDALSVGNDSVVIASRRQIVELAVKVQVTDDLRDPRVCRCGSANILRG